MSEIARSMDLERSAAGEAWTEERHASFLNWMEASFVRRVLRPEGDGGGDRRRIACYGERRPDRLDRHVPDSATESSAASPAAGRKRGAVTSASSPAVDLESGNGGTYRERTRRRSRPQNDFPGDQVVPLFGGKPMSDNK